MFGLTIIIFGLTISFSKTKVMQFSTDTGHVNVVVEDNILENVSQQYSQTLNEEEFVAFYYSLLERPELDTLFAEYTKETPGKMSPNDLLRFLQNEQKDGAAMVEECKEIIKYVPYLLLLDTCPTCLLLHHPNS